MWQSKVMYRSENQWVIQHLHANFKIHFPKQRSGHRIRSKIKNINYSWAECLAFYNIIYTSAHTLAKSLHSVSCANNNSFAVVVCFRLAFHASGMQFFLEILYHCDDVLI